jgi:hypothetical protein
VPRIEIKQYASVSSPRIVGPPSCGDGLQNGRRSRRAQPWRAVLGEPCAYPGALPVVLMIAAISSHCGIFDSRCTLARIEIVAAARGLVQ